MNRMNAFRTTLLGIISFLAIFFQNNSANAQGEYVDFDVFYNELTPHGNWYNDPEFGYVWQPRNNRNFQPYYTNGYWVMTEYGNTWVSNYSWGWAPFHYGRWTMTRIGWVWIPGNEWGPAWVDWRHGNGYYGWAPMGPRINLSINFNSWNTPIDWFVFVPQANIYNKFYSRYSRPSNFTQIYNNTIIVNNYYNGNNNRPLYNYGPRRDDIARATNKNITVYRVADAPTRSAKVSTRSNEIQMYRPTVRNSSNTTPRTVGNINDNTNRNSNGTSTRTSNQTSSRNITNDNTNATTSRTLNNANNTQQRKIDSNNGTNTSSTSRNTNSTSSTSRQNLSNINTSTKQSSNVNTNASRNVNSSSRTNTTSSSSSSSSSNRSSMNTSANNSSSRNLNTAPRNISPSNSSSNSSRSTSTNSNSSRSSSRTTDNNSGSSRTTR